MCPASVPCAAVIGVSGLVLTDDEAALLARFRPAGAILFRRNVGNPDQLRALTASLRSALPEGAVIMVDQEGGRVARLRPPHWHAHPPASGIGALYDTDPAAGLRAAWLTGALIGLDCAAAGFDTVCAPVLDLRHPGASDVVGDRSFGANPESVAALGAQVAAGLLAAGMQPVMKHLPGHGRALVDSHLSLPEVEGILPEELAPFIANHALPWAMTAHVVYRGHDRLPATLSPALVAEVIRGRIGFAGVLCSDDLAMHALSGPPETRALAALAAGCDLALYCGGEPAANAAVLSACPPLTAAAQARLASSRALAHISAAALDARELAAERDVLIR